MKQRKKILAVGLLAVFSVALFGAEALAATTAKKSVWSDYFSWDESKMIKKLAKDHIYSLIKKDSGWKKLIASKAKVKDGSISEDKIEDGAVSTEKLADHSVTADKIANNAVAADEIRDGTVISEDIEDNGIATVDLEDGAVTVAKMSSNSCTNGQILKYNGTAWACGADNSESTFGDSIDSSEITDGTVVDEDINASAAIAGSKIVPNFGSQNILTTGNIGIGTTSPLYALDIHGALGQLINLEASTGTDYAYGQFHNDGGFLTLGMEDSAGGGVIPGTSAYSGFLGTTQARSLHFITDDAVRATIDSDGNVGIGTTNPSAKLDLMGDMFISNSIVEGAVKIASLRSNQGNLGAEPEGWSLLYGMGGPTYNWLHVGGGVGVYNAATKIDFYTASDNTSRTGTSRMTIDGSGNVGIGTASPTEFLDVNSDTVRIRTEKTPASASATCDKGEIVWDANYVYVCVATDTWKRSAIATW